MDRDPYGDTRQRQQEINGESENETWKGAGYKETNLGKAGRGRLG